MGVTPVAYVCGFQRSGLRDHVWLAAALSLSLQGIDTIIFPILHLVYGSSSKLLFILYSEPYCEFIILPAKLYRSHIADVGFFKIFFLVYNVDWIIRNGGGGGE